MAWMRLKMRHPVYAIFHEDLCSGAQNRADEHQTDGLHPGIGFVLLLGQRCGGTDHYLSCGRNSQDISVFRYNRGLWSEKKVRSRSRQAPLKQS